MIKKLLICLYSHIMVEQLSKEGGMRKIIINIYYAEDQILCLLPSLSSLSARPAMYEVCKFPKNLGTGVS